MEQAPGTVPSNYNIANVLTVLRIVGVPVYGWILLHDGGGDESWRVWSFVAFSLLMITDRIDGDLARSRNLVTDFGKLADPIADKALTGMAFIGLSIIFDHWLFWTVTIVVLVREWGITLLRFVIKKYGVMPASQGGRIKTTLQATALGFYSLPLELWDSTASNILLWVTHVIMAGAVAITLVTGVQYVFDARRLRAEQKVS
ncbi:CDP-diacylglycerol--glycerol-3-phosphate 3-phosphatidyltransferase [Aeromicrobium sp. Root495]|uniref:CDP-alcohol phosphatidyltransferase family protein n=1 Tax=Aeromicrobium sp. Root495 TaxID=1736550 RepID=UPI000701ACD0|nr:CDP-alcohol phosphatidyltransferase family protein [Aeromicrobium sp. Root495]KQY59512.1 CDP-diacylglycerol--glycerol-3-phosphate 3-phosphatidyltransferase [Aeromicrobium sp. Root495]RYJ07074.1 MAG: CDP-diacylglycerol--glycerol-3-phosphate 3-phosphatidyltransferase [Actinomycetales bacterium]